MFNGIHPIYKGFEALYAVCVGRLHRLSNGLGHAKLEMTINDEAEPLK